MGMQLSSTVGPQTNNTGATPVDIRQGVTGEIIVGDGHGRYYETVSRRNAYVISGANQGVTAYFGGAGGTPLLAVHNPTNSGVNLVLLGISIANRTAASAAGAVSFAAYAGPSAKPTGTQTVPLNLYTMNQSGSAALGFVNTALTGSTALSYLFSPFHYYWATAAAAYATSGFFDFGGLIQVVPGNQFGFGASAVLTSAAWDVSLIWEEVPIVS